MSKAPKTEKKSEGRTEDHWLNKLSEKLFEKGRKSGEVRTEVRSTLVRHARSFAKTCLSYIPPQTNQLNAGAILLAACNTTSADVGKLCEEKINSALKMVNEAPETDERQYSDEKSGLWSVSDCKSILREAVNQNRNPKGKAYTLTKDAKFAFAAVINVIAEEFVDEVYKQHEKHDPESKHMLTLESVHAAEDQLASEGLIQAPTVRARGAHKRRRADRIESPNKRLVNGVH